MKLSFLESETMISMKSSGITSLLEEKNLTMEQRRRIIATSVALDLITLSISQHASTTTLSQEMKQLSEYVDAIELALLKR